MPKITIEWKKFDRPLPKIISEEYYINVKYQGKPILTSTFNYLKVFKWELLFVILGVISALVLANKWIKVDSIGEIVFAIFIIVGFFQAISLIISSISFITDYFIFRAELKVIKIAIDESNSYIEFCSFMAETNKSYIMHLTRLRENK